MLGFTTFGRNAIIEAPRITCRRQQTSDDESVWRVLQRGGQLRPCFTKPAQASHQMACLTPYSINCLRRGSSRSRSQSPVKFSDITVRNMATPGNTVGHQAVLR